MANSNNPFGFRPIIRQGGAPFSVREYAKPATEATYPIFLFDLVVKIAGAVSLPENSTYNLTTIQSGYAATMSSAVWVGAALGYGALSSATIHPVTDEIDVLYLAQGKTGTTYSTTSHVGKNADADKATAGSTTTKQSGMCIDGSTINTTNTLGLRLIQISMISPNAEGANAIFEVTINRHFSGNQIAGV